MALNGELSLPDSRGYVDREGLYNGLRSLFARAEDCADYHDVLNRAIHLLYQHVSEKGEEYGNMESGLGIICFSHRGNENGILTIDHTPSEKITREFKYSSAELGEVNLRDRTYCLTVHQTPYSLLEDTEKVMTMLGFEKIKKD